MSSENRIWTQNLYQEVTEARINSLQDHFAFSLELDGSTLAPTTPWAGLTICYGQFTIAGAGNTVLDSSRDWRDRALRVTIVFEAAAAELPKGASYDPDGATSVAPHVMYTGGGFDPAAGAGVFWTPSAGNFFGAADSTVGAVTEGDLFVRNTGAATYIMVWVEQGPDAS